MSRIGKLSVALGSEIQAEVSSKNDLRLKKGNQVFNIPIAEEISINIQDQTLSLKRKSDEKKVKACHGLYRSLIQNAVDGLLKGWSKSLKLNGVGYKALVSGNKLEMHLGYSQPVVLNIPEGVKVEVKKQTTLIISGVDKQKVGQFSAQIRSLRPPEPYLGKGVQYSDEIIRKKAGKSGAEKK